MRLLYSIFDLNLDNCLEIPQPLSQLEIKLKEEKAYQKLTPFLEKTAELVTLDQFSTKKTAEKTEHPNLKHLYVEVFIQHALFKYQDKPIGYGSNIIFYNGFPSVLSLEDFKTFNLTTFQEKYQQALQSLLDRQNPADALAQPVQGIITTQYLDQDFLKENRIYKVTKRWGIKKRELLPLELLSSDNTSIH